MTRLKTLCAPDKRIPKFAIEGALNEAVRCGNIEASAFLREEWYRSMAGEVNIPKAFSELTAKLFESLDKQYQSYGVTKVVGEPTNVLLDWLFAGQSDLGKLRCSKGRSMLYVAKDKRMRRALIF